jgi:Zn-dependent peptidase ImmA (M78 family)/DNA-binding XRE family transcriptional regulator
MNWFGNIYSVAHQFNPDRLKVAREFRGLQKKELAIQINVTPSALTQFENGTARPNIQTVARLSLALNFPPAFFASVKPFRVVSSDQCHFRSLITSSQTERRKMVSAATLIGDVIDFVDEHINLPPEEITPHIVNGVEDSEEIEELATKLRKDWGLGLGPINNIVYLLESKGILVFRILSDCRRVDGFSLWHNKRPLAFLNAEKGSASRSRLDAAHELGHLILHTDCIPGDRTHEQQAFRLGMAFMFPRESFIQEFPRRLIWPHLLEIKKRWKMSLASMVRRARDLGIYSEATYKRANLYINIQGWKLQEPDEPELEMPTILPQSIQLLSQNGISTAKIAEQLNFSERDLLSLVYADGVEMEIVQPKEDFSKNIAVINTPMSLWKT